MTDSSSNRFRLIIVSSPEKIPGQLTQPERHLQAVIVSSNMGCLLYAAQDTCLRNIMQAIISLRNVPLYGRRILLTPILFHDLIVPSGGRDHEYNKSISAIPY